mgnify:CR=1 FL=1
MQIILQTDQEMERERAYCDHDVDDMVRNSRNSILFEGLNRIWSLLKLRKKANFKPYPTYQFSDPKKKKYPTYGVFFWCILFSFYSN